MHVGSFPAPLMGEARLWSKTGIPLRESSEVGRHPAFARPF